MFGDGPPLTLTAADEQLVPDLARDLLRCDVLLAGVGVHHVQQAQRHQLGHNLDTVALRQPARRPPP